MHPIIQQNLKKIFKVDPAIKAYVLLGHNWVKLAPLALKQIFWETSLKWCLSVVHFYPADFEKILRADPAI